VIDRYEDLEQLTRNAVGRLNAESPWLVVSTAPARPASGAFMAADGDALQLWVKRQVSDWPAPLTIGSTPPDVAPDTLTFTPQRPPGESGESGESGDYGQSGGSGRSGASVGTYYYEFRSDGSALGALHIGVLRDSPSEGRPVWALGEGALAWITIALLRLNAAFAQRLTVMGRTAVSVAVVHPTAHETTAPVQVWRHVDGTYSPVGTCQSRSVFSARCTVDLTSCLSASLSAEARPLVLDVLLQFGVRESRHIDADGVIRRRYFTGHDRLIDAWTRAIGVPSIA
jgi:hypothetical protein